MTAIMIYVQHLLGIGHLMRVRLIAEALAGMGYDVHLVSGGMPVGGRMPRGVRMVQLPPIRVSDNSFTPLRDGNGVPIDEAYRQTRRDLLLAAYEASAPAAVIFETFPFGRRALSFEIVPLLERIESTRPRPRVIASIRDILQRQRKPEREHEMLGWAQRWFDAVLVHGDSRFARLGDTFGLAAELAVPVHYTGFVLAHGDPPPPRDAELRREVVVSAGGGAVGIALLEASLAARKLSRFGGLTWRVLAGPNTRQEDFERLLREAGPGVIVERARPDFPSLLRRAFVSLSQAGYNTVMDVVTSGARAVVVPFAGNGDTEQQARALRLRDFDLAVVIESGQCTPASLARAVDEAGSRPSWGCWNFDSDGAARSAQIVSSIIATVAPQRLAPPS
jgi:predicted glycosyltransferase